MKLKLLVFAISILFLTSCGNKVVELQKVIDGKAAELNTILLDTMNATQEGAKLLSKTFENQKNLGLDIKSMDKKNGGFWGWFQKHIYWQSFDIAKKSNYTISFLNDLYLPENIELNTENSKKMAKHLTANDPDFEKIQLDLLTFNYIASDLFKIARDNLPEKVWYGYAYLPKGFIQLHSFPLDVESSLPPGITHEMLLGTPWYQLGAPEKNQGLKDSWTDDAFVGMSGEGWLLTASSVFMKNGNHIGANTISLFVQAMVKSVLKDVDSNILVVSKNGALLGVSESVEKLKLFKDLAEFDYLVQLKENPDFLSEFTLTNSSQKIEIQELGRKILAGENNIKLTLNGNNYVFVTSSVKEVGFSVVGFTTE